MRPPPSIVFVLFAAATAADQPEHHGNHAAIISPNLAQATTHPYADPRGGRDAYRHSTSPINQYRLYDYYARQADYYLEGHPAPEILPAFPGLDAGLFGHWGKNTHLDHSDSAWSRARIGNVVGGIIHVDEQPVVKAVNVRLGSGSALAASFDPLTLSYRAVWQGGFLDLPTLRWGLMGNLAAKGSIRHSADDTFAWSDSTGETVAHQYDGYYKHGDQAVFAYRVNGSPVLDLPGTLTFPDGTVFTRTLEFPEGAAYLRLRLFKGTEQPVALRTTSDEAVLHSDSGYPMVAFGKLPPGSRVQLIFGAEHAATSDRSIPSLATLTAGGPAAWPTVITLPGSLGAEPGPYVVDTIPIPLGNPYLSPMFLAGLAFFENGDAAVSTFFGDVWRVGGLDATLRRVTWKRIATGLHQPLGVDVVDGQIHVLGRDQITVLRDLNGDGETDFYQNFCNDYVSSDGGHDYNTGLQRDPQGNFYFATKHVGVYRISPDGKRTDVFAAGIRNPNGIAVGPDGRVYTAPQEGEWTPASMIIEAREGGFYGFGRETDPRPLDLPLCYVPRGIDNSTGAPVAISSASWGPFGGHLLALSYGYCSHYLVLRDSAGSVPQAAIVPLAGEFLAGAHRGRFHPGDGQLYVAGTQGWGTYAQYDGSFQRVRFTGEPVRYPTGYRVFSNGIRIDFAEPLDPAATSDPGRYFYQQWNYQYSKGYGSPEFSVRHPDTLGHDRLAIRSVTALPGGRSLFVEIPEIGPAMQGHLRLHLRFADGAEFATELFPTIAVIDARFEPTAGAVALADPERQVLSPRIAAFSEDARPQPRSPDEPGRPVRLKVISGLRFDRNSIQVRAGEAIALTLENTDVMPHNWVLGASQSYAEIGSLSDLMIHDPQAVRRHYIPDTPKVLAFVPIVDPGESRTVEFVAPAEPGTYPFLCTYPGHWQAMKGTLIVY